MTMPALAAPRHASDALQSLGGLAASLVPALMLGYMLVLWPLAFGDSTVSVMEDHFGWLAPLDAGASSDSPLKQLAYPALFVLAVAGGLFTMAYRRVPLTHPGILAMALIVALAAASTLWSPFPKLSLMRAFLLAIIITTLVLAVYSASSFQLMMRALFVALFAATLVNLWAVMTQPPGPIGHNGIYPHKNFFGWVAVVILFFGLYHLTFGGLLQRAAAALMVVAVPLFLVKAESKTSLGLAVLCPVAGLMLVYAARRMRLSAGIVVPAGVLLLTLVFFLGEAAGFWTFQSLNQKLLGDATLTGRTDIWSFAADLIARRPLLGYGYEAVWGTGYDGIPHKNALGFTRVAPTGHNGYVDMLLHLGAAGFALKLAFLMAALACAGRLARMDVRLGWLSLTLAVFILLHNNLESDVFISSNPLSALLILFFLIGLRLTGTGRPRNG